MESNGATKKQPLKIKSWQIPLAIILVATLLSFYTATNSNTETSNQNILIPRSEVGASKEVVMCTSVEYSNWSLCSERGIRIRNIISAYPQGCKFGDILQQESCVYVPIKLDAETLIQRAFQKISLAPSKTIEAEYVSGQNGNMSNVVRYSIADDNNLVMWIENKDRQSGKVIKDVYLRDSNQDYRPDIFSNDGATWYPINIQSQSDQVQILSIWTVQMAYFVDNLLKK